MLNYRQLEHSKPANQDALLFLTIMIYFAMVAIRLSQAFKRVANLLCLLFICSLLRQIESARVLEIGNQLQEFIEKYPDKSWLVKFYAPWCHHCQQLEPTFINVAERMYHEHDGLIVARVDCTKSGRVCEKFAIESYPTIVFLGKNVRVNYKGDRSEESLISFAVRLTKPSINEANDCGQLKDAANQHGLVVLSTIKNSSNILQKEFELLADRRKSDYWFYHFDRTCEDFLNDEGLYILKRHLDRPINFKPRETVIQDELQSSLVSWVRNESYPVYGRFDRRNVGHIQSMQRTLVLVLLNEYKPAKQFAPSSQKLHKLMEKLAREHAQQDDKFVFAWTSDIELFENLAIQSTSSPNVMVLRPDYRFKVLLKGPQESQQTDGKEADVPDQLKEKNLRLVLSEARDEKLDYDEGYSYFFATLRFVLASYGKVWKMYQANPLLVMVLFGFPITLVAFVIYSTCCMEVLYGEDENADDDGYEDPDERQQLLSNGHIKQD